VVKLADMQVRYAIFSTEWGYFGLAGNKKCLLRTHLPCPKFEMVEKRLLAGFDLAKYEQSYFHTIQEYIIAYFEGTYVNFYKRIPLSTNELSPFNQIVLNACRQIPYGCTTTYGALAKAIHKPLSSRAVGTALSQNPLPLIIPCHRVIRNDGKMGGFTAYGGAQLKYRMLKLEKASV
jgi:methylated-DNA-[protein]-cysteine S-methyltransferase